MKKTLFKNVFLLMLITFLTISCNLAISLLEDPAKNDPEREPATEPVQEKPGAPVTEPTVLPAVTATPIPGVTIEPVPTPSVSQSPTPIGSAGNMYLSPTNIKVIPDQNFITQLHINAGNNIMGSYTISIIFDNKSLVPNYYIEDHGVELLPEHTEFKNIFVSDSVFTLIGSLNPEKAVRGDVHILNLYWRSGLAEVISDIELVVTEVRDPDGNVIANPNPRSCRVTIGET